VIREADEVVARFAIGIYDLLRLPQAVRTVRVAVEVAAKETAFSVLEQVSRHGDHSLRL
jgi:hypothetical protein